MSEYWGPYITYFLLGDVYDGMETSKTLDMPEKKRYKRPSSGGVRHTRRSASAEMIDREDDEMMGDNENLSPARRRPRRKKTHGQLSFLDLVLTLMVSFNTPPWLGCSVVPLLLAFCFPVPI